MINIFENYGELEKDLEDSLSKAGYNYQTVVLYDDGYLPEHVISPINFFINNNNDKERSPKFFNDIELPSFWEIKGNAQYAEIFDGYKRKGKINYSSLNTDYRSIKSIEWLNDQGNPRMVDLYNQQGGIFGKLTYSDGSLTLGTYLNNQRQEVLLINYVTNTIQVHYAEKWYYFNTFIDFIVFFFETSGIESDRIFYNSLGNPFFITKALKDKFPKIAYKNILFWQEESTKIPGNMLSILNDKFSATKDIIIQDENEYARISEQVTLKYNTRISNLGFLYQYNRKPKLKKSIFILTNSDQIAYLEEIAQLLPEFTIKVAARTEMSSKLMSTSKIPNIVLYPNIDSLELQRLIDGSAIYLDINYGNEVENIVRQVFLNNILIYGFTDTVHNTRFSNSKNIVEKSDVRKLIKLIQHDTKSLGNYRRAITKQQKAAGETTPENYKEVIE